MTTSSSIDAAARRDDAPALPAPASAAAPCFPPRIVRRWLWIVAGLTGAMVVVGGFVRLSRAGLSIVEWDVLTGVVPPIGHEAWTAAFARYQATPEGIINLRAGMTLDGYREIFLIEWFHRLLARAAGLAVLAPLVVFVARGTIPRRRALPYVGIVLLFGLQGLLGWLMVASGLVDRPAVSHYRLTAHLLTALLLLAWCIWLALGPRGGPAAAATSDAAPGIAGRPFARRMAGLLLAVLVAQIAWGGLVAGLKAGHVSSTWPRMSGQWVPAGLTGSVAPWWLNFLEAPLAVHFAHRWLAWAVAAAALAAWWAVRRAGPRAADRRAHALAAAIVALVVVQIALGVGVVMMRVALPVALIHQATAVGLFAATVALNHRLSAR